MHSVIVALVRGFVRIRVRGEQPELLLNRLLDERIIVWNISRLEHELEMDIHLSDFFLLRKFLRETGCRMHVLERFGLPFWLARLERRKFLAGGAVVFIVGLYLLSSLIWSVEIAGNDRVSAKEIRDVAAEQGIYRWAWKYRLADLDDLSSRMLQQLPDAAWVGVSVQGTRVRIEIVEHTVPEQNPLMNPRHLVSTSDAVVTEIFAERGKPVVRRNMVVKKGDVLISGIIGDEDMQQVVVAKGEVKGLVWHEYDVSVSLTQKRKVYTGNQHRKFYLIFGNRALQITGYGKDKYEQEVVFSEQKKLGWRGLKLPFGWMNEYTKESRLEQYEIDENKAKEIGLSLARADIAAKFGLDAKIYEEKILHEKMDNGKVYMKVLYEIEHVISREQPIVYEEIREGGSARSAETE